MLYIVELTYLGRYRICTNNHPRFAPSTSEETRLDELFTDIKLETRREAVFLIFLSRQAKRDDWNEEAQIRHNPLFPCASEETRTRRTGMVVKSREFNDTKYGYKSILPSLAEGLIICN